MMQECENCTYWKREEGERHGWCRRHPPVVMDLRDQYEQPITDEDDWCGEYVRKVKA